MDPMQQISLIVAVVLLLGAGILAGIGARGERERRSRSHQGSRGEPIAADTRPIDTATQRRRGRGAKRPTGLLGSSRRNREGKSGALRELDVGLMCAEIATRLEAGASIETAWDTTLRRLDPRLDFGAVQEFVANPQAKWWQRVAGRFAPGSGRGRRAGEANPLALLRHREAVSQALHGMLVATRVATQVGAPLAEILNRVADGIAANLEAAAKRHTAQVGPKATAKLLGLLPLAALLMAQFIGVDVVDMAMSGGLNTWIFVIGAGLMLAGNLWSGWMIRRAAGVTTEGLDPTLAMDIIAACQQNGVSLTATLEAVSLAAEEPDLKVVARMLLLGADWEEAWAQADPKWSELASVLEPAWEEGASPVPLLVRGASRTRAAEIHRALDAAERLGVRLMIPLGVCLLPAFFALGIVPVVVSTIEGMIMG